MVTNPAEYAKLLWKIQDQNPPTTALLLPNSERLIEVDLNTRLFSAPEYLSVATDHRAETVFFVMDRFHDNVDLSEMNCVVEFTVGSGTRLKSGLYVVPFIDKDTLHQKDCIIVPWLIEGLATREAGIITYSLKFYKVLKDNYSKFAYILNTQPAKSRILEGNNFDGTAVQSDVEKMLGSTMEEIIDSKTLVNFADMTNNVQWAYEYLVAKMNEIQRDKQLDVYWIDV